MTSLVKDCFWERPSSFIQNYFSKYSKNLIELFKIILTKKRFYWRYHSHQYNWVICKNATSIKKKGLYWWGHIQEYKMILLVRSDARVRDVLLVRSHSRVQDVYTGEVRRKSTWCFTGDVTWKTWKSISYLHRIGSLQVLHQHVWDWEGDSEPERRVRMVGV